MVEWKKLDTLLDFEQPTPYLVKSTEYDNSYDTPVLTAGQSLLLGYTNETDGIYEASKENPCIIFDDFTTSFHWIDYNFKVKSSAMKMLRPQKDVNFRYVYYSMCGINFVPGGHQRHWISKYSQFEIPMPAPSEQNRIVDILDTFTASIDNLKEQIAQRRKQYEYYRDQLLDLEGKPGVEMKALNDCCTLITKQTGFDYSKTIKPSLTTNQNEDSIPFIQNKDFEGTRVNLNTDFYIPISVAKKFPKILLNEKILLISISGKIGNVGLYEIGNISFVGGAICVCRLRKNISGKYILYYLQSNKGQGSLFHSVKAASHSNITVESIRLTTIPFPAMVEQQRIVSILDTFEASIQNLEAQLKQREKQYEYYRNKLLTFE